MHPNICLIVYRYASFSHMLVRTNISQASNTTVIQFSAGDAILTHKLLLSRYLEKRTMLLLIVEATGQLQMKLLNLFLWFTSILSKVQKIVYMPVLFCDVKNRLVVYMVHIMLRT